MSDETTETLTLHSAFAKLKELPVIHGVLLALFALATALILALVNGLTLGPIADRATEDLYASLAQVLPEEIHDNDVTAGPLVVDDPEAGLTTVYVATKGGVVTGVAYEMTTFGYGGRIQVLLGVDPQGQLFGARVLSHAETPGLGDKIELAKDSWVLAFTGRSLTDPTPEKWKVQKDGGIYDQFSGATITPRAVVFGVRQGLEFFDRNHATLMEPR